MGKQLTKIFLTILILLVGGVLENYSIDFINVHDDLISGLSALMSVTIILLIIYGVYKLWEVKTEIKNNN